MKNNDNFEEKIYNYFKENRDVPDKITQSIYEVKLQKNKYKMFSFDNIRKIAITAISLITVSTGVVFAKDIAQFVKNIFKDNSGVNTAIENGYIYNDLNKVSCESENVKVQIEQMLMDDYTLDLGFLIEFNNNINIGEYENFGIPDILVTDEEENVLCFWYINSAKQFFKGNGKDVSNQFIINNSVNTSSSIFITDCISENSAMFTLNCSAVQGTFPRSKKIYIQFNTIELKNGEKIQTINGNWKICVDVPKLFINRQTIGYKVTKCNNEKIYKDTIIGEVYESGMNFKMSMYWGDYETEHTRTEELRRKNILDSQIIKQEESYVENEYGEKFYSSQTSSDDGGYSLTTDGNLHIWQTFNLTKFNSTDKLKVVLTTIDNEQIIIELEK